MSDEAPFRCGPFAVEPGWIDENGHVNLAYYVVLFDWATDALWAELGLGAALRAGGLGTFAVEAHTLHRAELLCGQEVVLEAVVVGADGKRLHVAHQMATADGVVRAQQELLFLCVSLATRRVAAWPAAVAERLGAAVGRAPDWVGRSIRRPEGFRTS